MMSRRKTKLKKKKRKRKREKNPPSQGAPELVVVLVTVRVVEHDLDLVVGDTPEQGLAHAAALGQKELTGPDRGLVHDVSHAANQGHEETVLETVADRAHMIDQEEEHAPLLDQSPGSQKISNLAKRKIHDETAVGVEIVRIKKEKRNDRRRRIGKIRRRIKKRRKKKRKSQRFLGTMMRKNNLDMMGRMRKGRREIEKRKIRKTRMRQWIWIFVILLEVSA